MVTSFTDSAQDDFSNEITSERTCRLCLATNARLFRGLVPLRTSLHLHQYLNDGKAANDVILGPSARAACTSLRKRYPLCAFVSANFNVIPAVPRLHSFKQANLHRVRSGMVEGLSRHRPGDQTRVPVSAGCRDPHTNTTGRIEKDSRMDSDDVMEGGDGVIVGSSSVCLLPIGASRFHWII
ncbi:hypothetical protein BU26DRAFT_242164 [Trematosphaeria pertusa]|uniref:Uncharacterized protein n=1 Tax=Trematosphaeria pertusa TaxID=390896 RepID=A0A6A6INP1_9PLEO|nr:uncharacterized protein BU26DRAFT_242164 [Trematosphaeria pertusa]KAF2251718.1 hypothetical protein BU26DRAFT_242164 [Trematosphaeria pertusa]